MSRGLGAAQRFLLEFATAMAWEVTISDAASLRASGITLRRLGWSGGGREQQLAFIQEYVKISEELPLPTRSQVESMRRAAHGLKARGLLDLTRSRVLDVDLPGRKAALLRELAAIQGRQRRP